MNEIINPKNLIFTSEQLNLLIPYFIVLIGGCVSLLAGVIKASSNPELNQLKRNQLSFFSAIISLVIAALSISNMWGETNQILFNGMMKVDYFTNLFNIIFIITTVMVLMTSFSYLEKEGIHHAEFYSLAVFSCLGMMLLASAVDMIVLFISLEIMSIAMYVLVGFRRNDVRSNEAALKYFILGSAVSAIMLYGIALIYGTTGTMNLEVLAHWVRDNSITNPLFVLGSVLLVVGFLFKVAVVPFHMWMPDVYEGAPTVITNFMTTGLKAAAFATFLRVFFSLNANLDHHAQFNSMMHNIFWLCAVLTMFIGNVIAIAQKNIKRMLAYSSIAHSGYILIGLLCGRSSEYGYSAVIMYLITYVIANIGAFSIISMLSEKGDTKTDIEDFSGIGFKKPFLGFAMTVFMFSMAGVPPTAGFSGKYLIFSSAAQSGEIWLAILGVLCSAISAFFYLRVIVYMYMKDPIREFLDSKHVMPAMIVIALATLTALHFGLFPTILINAAKKAALSI